MFPRFLVAGDGINRPPTDEELDGIIDRSRREDDSIGGLMGGASKRADAFDAETAMLNLRELQGTVYEKSEAKSFTNCKASMSDIGAEWAELTAAPRARQSRFSIQHVVGVGAVNVLKANDYSLEAGESSVWTRELGASAAASLGKDPERRRQVILDIFVCGLLAEAFVATIYIMP